MATKSLTFDIFGRDRGASKTMDKVGRSANEAGKGFKQAGIGISIGIAAASAAIGAFAIDSVKAFAEAEDSQNKLAFAYEKFPALADTNIDAMRRMNTEMAKKTRYDDDAYAVGQATLAQYGLTGQQLMDLTPLLADYAGKTGKDLPTAAEDLGKAMLGQGRALKAVGIDFTDTGSVAGNFDAIMQGLRTQVGGFAEKDAETASGKLDIMKNKFGEVQEAVGEKLLDPLSDVMDELTESGAVEDLGTALADVVQGFSDLEKNTGFLSDFMKDMSGFDGMVDDLQKVGDWFARGGLFNNETNDEMNDNIKKQGGLLGGLVSWSDDTAKALDDFFGSHKPDMKTQIEDAMREARTGMGGGMSAMRGDMDLFSTDMSTKWGTTWSNADGSTRAGMGNVAASTGAGLLDVLGRVLGFSGQPGPAMVSAWAGADSATVGGWGNIEASTGAGVGRVGAKVGEIQGAVRSPFANAGTWLFSAGVSIVDSLIDGMRGMIGEAGRAASDVMSTIAGFIPHSPAKWGPFSGSGWQAVADGGAALREQFMGGFTGMGMNIGAGFDEDIANAMDKSHATIETLVTPSPTVSASGGYGQMPPITIVLESRGGVDLTQYINARIEDRDAAAVRVVRAGRSK